MAENNTTEKVQLISIISWLLLVVIVLVIGMVALVAYWSFASKTAYEPSEMQQTVSASNTSKSDIVYWTPKDISAVTDTALRSTLEYGKDLIAHTAKYLGPSGSVMQITNGMNCQNCHLDAGTKIYGNNYGSVNSHYPKFRPRSGSIENIYKRINDCLQRSLNGKPLDTAGKEIQSIAVYINFIGSNVEKGEKAEGSGLKNLDYLDRAADSSNGRIVYVAKCQSCHQSDGAGMPASDRLEYTYPPLWGAKSYNDGAGLYRISNFAKYVKYNMPQGTQHDSPQLTDEEAWDVAAFVNSRPRPHLSVPKDWPDKSKKPVDHPFGPYADKFSETQHKFGPFKPIVAEQKKREGTK